MIFPGYVDFLKMDDVWPITANYELHNSLYDPDFNGATFNWQTNVGASFPISMEFQGTLATVPAPAVLGISDPYWIPQNVTAYAFDPSTGLPALVFSAALADVAAYTNSGSLYLNSGANNLFGLAFTTALVNQNPVTTLATGSSVALTNANCFTARQLIRICN